MMKTSLLTRKTTLVALLLAAALFLTGCNLVVKDPEVDKAQVILSVNGEEVNKETFTGYLNNAYNRAYEEQMMYQQMYGYQPQPLDPNALLEATLDNTAKDIMLHQKAHELGLDALSAEEEAALTADADAQYADILEQIKLYYFANTELEGEELQKALEDQAAELNLSRDAFVESAKEGSLHEKLHEYAGKDVIINDEEVQASFDQKVEEATASYTADPAAFENAVSGGQPVYYTPVGYRYVRQILIQLPQEDQDAIKALETELAPLQTALSQAQAAADRYTSATRGAGVSEEDLDFVNQQQGTLGTEAAELSHLLAQSGLDSQQQERLAALEAKLPVFTELEMAKANVEARQSALNEARDAAFAKIQPEADEVLALAQAEGADFEALVAEYDQDPGQPARGYLVGAATTRFVPEFTAGALALEQIGDVSQPIRTSYGVHILRYNEDVAEGPAVLADVQEAIREELHTARAEEIYHELEETWLAEAAIVKYPERMKD